MVRPAGGQSVWLTYPTPASLSSCATVAAQNAPLCGEITRWRLCSRTTQNGSTCGSSPLVGDAP
jgi:hypothetical protein